MPRRLAYIIPLLMVLALLAAIGAALYAEQERHAQKSRLEVFYKLSTVQGIIENRLNERLQLAKAIKSFVMHNPDLTQASFARFTGSLLSSTKGIRRVILARENVVSHVFPSKEMAKSIGLDLLLDYTRGVRELIAEVEDTRKHQLSRPLSAIQGEHVILSATPVPLPSSKNEGEQGWGVVLVFIDANGLFQEAAKSQGASSLEIALREPGLHSGEFVNLFGNEQVFSTQPVIMNIPIPNNYWQVAAVPAGGWADSPNRAIILYGGGLFVVTSAGFLCLLVYLLLRGIQEREKYRYLIQNAKSIILRLDMSGNIVFCNEYADTFFGFEHGGLIGKPIIGTLVPVKNLEGEPSKRFINRLLDNPAAHTFNENVCTRKNGELVWVAWANEPVEDSDGNMIELLCVGTDITDRKIMEDARKQSERQYRVLAENMTDIIMGLDAERCYTYVSPSDESLRGFGRHEILGRPINDFLTPQSARLFDEVMDKLVSRIKVGERSPSTTLDLEFTCSDDTTVWLEARFGLLLNEDAVLIGMQSVCRDISDRKRADMLREDMERMARHDLKTPLGAVVGLPGEIRRLGELSPVQDGMLSTIEEAGENMLELINRSLDLYKMETGAYVLETSAVDVLQVVEFIRKETRALVREKGISMGLEVPGGSSDTPFYVTVEEPLFRSMLSNLIMNAFQASPEGGVVTISLEQKENVVITIRNMGEVPEDIREMFFDKYVSSASAGGSGLGTYSARLIARTHGGDVSVDTSTPGETSLTITLPM